MAAKKKPLWTNSTLIILLTVMSLVVGIATCFFSFSSVESISEDDKKQQKAFKSLSGEIAAQSHPQITPPPYADKMARQNKDIAKSYVDPYYIFYSVPPTKAKRNPIIAYYIGGLSVKVIPDYDKITLTIGLSDINKNFQKRDPNSKRTEKYPHVDPKEIAIEVQYGGSKLWKPTDPIGNNKWQYVDTRDLGRAERRYKIRAKAKYPNAETMPAEINKGMPEWIEGQGKQEGIWILKETEVEKEHPKTIQAITKKRYDIILTPESSGKEKANLKIVDKQKDDVPERQNCVAGDTIGKTPYTLLNIVNLTRSNKVIINDAGEVEQIVLDLNVYTSENPDSPTPIHIECYNDVLAPTRMTNKEMIQWAVTQFKTKIEKKNNKTQNNNVKFVANEKGLIEKCLEAAITTARKIKIEQRQIYPISIRAYSPVAGPMMGKYMRVAVIKDLALRGEDDKVSDIVAHYAPAEGYKRLDKRDDTDLTKYKLIYYVQKFNKSKKKQYNNTLYGPYELEIGDKATTAESVEAEIQKDVEYKNADNKFLLKKDRPESRDKPLQAETDYRAIGYAKYNFSGVLSNTLSNFVLYSDLTVDKPVIYFAHNTPDAPRTTPTKDELARKEIEEALVEQVTTGSRIISDVNMAEAVTKLTGIWPDLKGKTQIDSSMADIKDIRFDIELDNRLAKGKEFLDKIVEGINTKLQNNKSDLEVRYVIGAKILFKAQKK